MGIWLQLGSVMGIWAVVVMSPGPDTLAVASTAIGHSRRAGMLVALGCAVATFMWAAASLAGLAIIFERAQWLYHLLKWIGAAYLIYLGISLLRQLHTGDEAGGPEKARSPVSGWRAFRLGLVTDLANPKAAAFFTSLFAVALSPGSPIWLKVIVASFVTAIAGIWYVILAAVLSTGPAARFYVKSRKWIEGSAGILFIALGGKLATDR
ncbi:LysE family transporter [Allosphingosinicella flava]|uniref:LysE family transporter n=1 Tax=Allosphingosinicella flava TaxID=2771430 RepID=A0A7T2GJI1_9SPHN|nr:LysE family transporter [Sphingosinicella flava]QPQ55032.1 LysE family transporter [Sphingosinicella flava]